MRIGIVGATGWLGTALGRRVIATGLADVVALNRSGPRPGHFGAEVTWARDAADLARHSDVIVAAVRPHDWPDVALRAEGALLVSFMAGVSLATLAQTGARVVRAMPNAAAEIGRSYSPWFAGADVTQDDRAVVRSILATIGTGDELTDEAQIDLMAAVSGSGPGYPALMAVAMADVLRAEGVTDRVARRAAAAVLEAGAMAAAGSPEDLIAALMDYRGVTAAGIERARAAGFDRAIAEALRAAVARSRAMTAGA